MDLKERLSLVRKVVAVDGDLKSLETRLKSLPWDHIADERVTLTRRDVASVLDRFCRGSLSAADVELWANLLEGRDDVEYELGAEDQVAEAIDTLANPALNGELSVEAADVLARTLSLN